MKTCLLESSWYLDSVLVAAASSAAPAVDVLAIYEFITYLYYYYFTIIIILLEVSRIPRDF